MVYEVISPEAHGNGTIVGMRTESPACIDSLDGAGCADGLPHAAKREVGQGATGAI